MSASGFRVTRVSPLLGRTLGEADEQPGAPRVIVIGHDVWTNRFTGDPRVVGRIVRLGREQATVVGVMPERFAFPAAASLWVPLRDEARGLSRAGGQDFLIFGRLARDTPRARAQRELSPSGGRTAIDSPETPAAL